MPRLLRSLQIRCPQQQVAHAVRHFQPSHPPCQGPGGERVPRLTPTAARRCAEGCRADVPGLERGNRARESGGHRPLGHILLLHLSCIYIYMPVCDTCVYHIVWLLRPTSVGSCWLCHLKRAPQAKQVASPHSVDNVRNLACREAFHGWQWHLRYKRLRR